MTLRAVCYARVSSDDTKRDGRNLAGQLEMCRKYAVEHGYGVVAELAEDDRGASGAAFELEQLDRTRDMARAGEFDVLVVREIDRLSRSLAKQLIVEEELRRADVRIEYVLGEYPDTPEGNLMKNVRASVAEYERLKIQERMERGRVLKVKAGSVMTSGHPIFGYAIVNSGSRFSFEIIDEEVAIVRQIFDWYVHGDSSGQPLTLVGIQKRLQAMRIRSKADRKEGTDTCRWPRSSLAYILDNLTYTGEWQYNGPGGEVITVPVPAIISREVYDLAAIKREHNRQSVRQTGTRDYLLGGILRCGECGRIMTGSTNFNHAISPKEYSYYRCRATNTAEIWARTCSNRMLTRVELADAAVWGWVKSFLLQPEQLAEGLQRLRNERASVLAPIRERLSVIDGLLAKYQEQLDKLLDLYLNNEFSKEAIMERKLRLQGNIAGLQREQAGLHAKLEAATLTEEQIQSVQEFAALIADGMDQADEEGNGARRRVLQALNTTATLKIENGQRFVDVQCELGGPATLRLLSNRLTGADSPGTGSWCI